MRLHYENIANTRTRSLLPVGLWICRYIFFNVIVYCGKKWILNVYQCFSLFCLMNLTLKNKKFPTHFSDRQS